MSDATRTAIRLAGDDLAAAESALKAALTSYVVGDRSANRTAVDDAIEAWGDAADSYDTAADAWFADPLNG